MSTAGIIVVVLFAIAVIPLLLPIAVAAVAVGLVAVFLVWLTGSLVPLVLLLGCIPFGIGMLILRAEQVRKRHAESNRKSTQHMLDELDRPRREASDRYWRKRRERESGAAAQG